ncbi:hypothetical protein ACFL2E_10630 [Thermodesulfobacteriota bacterium]
MAWTDACKYEACNQVEHKKETEGISARRAIRVLSKESGIPQGTIRRWVYPSSDHKKVVPEMVQQPLETCAISDLYGLINSGKQFSTIYADPPWKYSNQATRFATDNHYDTMTVDEIAELPISQLTTENAHLGSFT